MGTGDWGLGIVGIGDWGLGTGDWGLGMRGMRITNAQCPIPNAQT
ncbi:MAG: hypothetical protein V7L26_17265 [Nostoc sp.]